MDKNTLAAAQHYYDIDRYEAAYKQLIKLDLVIDRTEQIEHHILLSLVLDGLDRRAEAQEIADALRHKFPDNYRCLTHWITFTCGNHRLVEQAFDLAGNLRKRHPTDYWLPFIMAKMAFAFRLRSPKTIISLAEDAMSLYANEQTLGLAYTVFTQFKLSERSAACLDKLVENHPDSEATYELLLEDLKRKKNYSELSQISYTAIRKFPRNEAFTEHYKLAINKRYGSFLDKLFYSALNIGDPFIIDRSSTKSWFRSLQQISVLFSAFLTIAATVLSLLFYLTGIVFFLHYTVFASDDRQLKKQRKKRLLKREFEHNDRTLETQDAASALVASTHLKYKLIHLDSRGITLAEEAFCALEDLHTYFNNESLKGDKQIPYNMIKEFMVSTNYLNIKTKRHGPHLLYFEHLPTLEFVVQQLEKRGYYRLRTKKSSRILLSIACFFGAKAGLGIAFLIAAAASWQIGLVFALAAISNTIGFFVYRFIHPLATDIYISKYR